MLIALIVQTIVIAFLLVFIYLSTKQINRERQRLTNAVLARTPQEFALLNKQDALSERKSPKPEEEPPIFNAIGI